MGESASRRVGQMQNAECDLTIPLKNAQAEALLQDDRAGCEAQTR